MIVHFLGYHISNRQKRTIERATELALEFLVSKRLANTLDIQYHIVKDLYSKEGVFGDCFTEDYDRSPKFFDVRLSWTKAADIHIVVSTICHEMIHVAQYSQRRLRYLARSNVQAFEKEHVDMNEVKYYELPWEKEAYEKEDEVYAYVRKHMADRYYINLQEVDQKVAELYAKKQTDKRNV
jgi:hypothetical protein